MALAMYYVTLPPLLGRDVDRALGYYDEFTARAQRTFEPYRLYVNAATLLLATGREEDRKRAQDLLRAALSDPRPYYFAQARSLLEKIQGPSS